MINCLLKLAQALLSFLLQRILMLTHPSTPLLFLKHIIRLFIVIWAQVSILSQGVDTWLSQKNKYLELNDVFMLINNVYRRSTGEKSQLLCKSRFIC